jgi:CMP-N-acetylneuraminic acid synthetase
LKTGLRIVGIIPARGGSLGVTGKNLRPLAGKPLIGYTFAAARNSELLSDFIVATESADIANYALAERVDVLSHPSILSSDTASSFPVIEQAVRRLSNPAPIDICVTLRATSPLNTGEDIDNAIRLLISEDSADSVVSVVAAEGIHPVRLKRVTDSGFIEDAFGSEGPFPKRRQELEKLYVRNGAIYATRAATIERGTLWGSRSLAYIMSEERSININTDFQFRVAELLILDEARKTGRG